MSVRADGKMVLQWARVRASMSFSVPRCSRPMCGSLRSTCSPSSSSTSRSTPCAAGCCGPKFSVKFFTLGPWKNFSDSSAANARRRVSAAMAAAQWRAPSLAVRRDVGSYISRAHSLAAAAARMLAAGPLAAGHPTKQRTRPAMPRPCLPCERARCTRRCRRRRRRRRCLGQRDADGRIGGPPSALNEPSKGPFPSVCSSAPEGALVWGARADDMGRAAARSEPARCSTRWGQRIAMAQPRRGSPGRRDGKTTLIVSAWPLCGHSELAVRESTESAESEESWCWHRCSGAPVSAA